MLFCKPNCLYSFYLQDIMTLFWREWMTGCHSSPLTIGLASEEGEDDSPIFLAVNVFKLDVVDPYFYGLKTLF